MSINMLLDEDDVQIAHHEQELDETPRERGILKVATNSEVVDVPPLIEAVVEMKRKLDLLHNRVHELNLKCPMEGDCYKRQNHGFQPQAQDAKDVEIAQLREYARLLAQQQSAQYPPIQQIYPQGWTTPNAVSIVPQQTLTGTTNNGISFPQWFQAIGITNAGQGTLTRSSIKGVKGK